MEKALSKLAVLLRKAAGRTADDLWAMAASAARDTGRRSQFPRRSQL
jgi:hypothetical protein